MQSMSEGRKGLEMNKEQKNKEKCEVNETKQKRLKKEETELEEGEEFRSVKITFTTLSFK